jgi:hypothetical protein
MLAAGGVFAGMFVFAAVVLEHQVGEGSRLFAHLHLF